MPEILGSLIPPRQSAAPSSPVQGQLYFDTDDNTLYWWSGTSWVAASAGLGGPPSGPAGGSLNGNYPNPSIAPGAVGWAELADDAVQSGKIAAGSVFDSDVADNAAIGYGKLNLSDSIVAGDIKAGAVGLSELAANSVDSSKIVDGSIVDADVSTIFGRSVTQSISATPPASPQAGDFWIYRHATGVWFFTYDAAGNATYPWACIGGGPLVSQRPADTTIAQTANAWTAGPANVVLNAPRAGNYWIESACSMRPGTGGCSSCIGVQISGANPAVYDGTWTAGGYSPVASARTNHYIALHGTGLAANAALYQIYANTVTQNMVINNAMLAITPTRVA